MINRLILIDENCQSFFNLRYLIILIQGRIVVLLYYTILMLQFVDLFL